MKTIKETLMHIFPLLPLPPDPTRLLPWVGPHSTICPLLLASVSNNHVNSSTPPGLSAFYTSSFLWIQICGKQNYTVRHFKMIYFSYSQWLIIDLKKSQKSRNHFLERQRKRNQKNGWTQKKKFMLSINRAEWFGYDSSKRKNFK